MAVKTGRNQKKLLTLLLAGVAFSLSRSPRRQLRILTEDLPKEFAKINLQNLEYSLHRLYADSHISMKKIGPNLYQPFLTDEGKAKAKSYSIDDLAIPACKKWDKKWRVVMFDIPEKLKKVRDSIRFHLKRLGFVEIQKSVFCFPYPCGREIMKVVDFHNADRFVKYLVAEELSGAEKFLDHFGLSA